MSIAHGGDITAGRGGSAYAQNAAQFASNAIQAGNNATQSLANATTAFREKFKADDERAIFKQKMEHADKEMALKEHQINTETALAREKMDLDKQRMLHIDLPNSKADQTYKYASAGLTTANKNLTEQQNADTYLPINDMQVNNAMQRLIQGEKLDIVERQQIINRLQRAGIKLPRDTKGNVDLDSYLAQAGQNQQIALANARGEFNAQTAQNQAQNAQSYATQDTQNQIPSVNLGGGVHIKYENGQIKRNGEVISQNDKRYFGYAEKLGLNPQTSWNRK